MITKAERTRQFIIEQAATVLNKKGMAGTSISDIMEVTKLAKGGIYGNFENKEEICLEAFNFLAQKQVRNMLAAMQNEVSAKGKLFALIDHFIKNVAQSETGGCPILNFGTEADDTNPEIKAKVGIAIKHTEDSIAAIIKDGIAAGDFKSGIDSHAYAIKMYTMLEGAILVSQVLGTTDQMQTVAKILKSEIELF